MLTLFIGNGPADLRGVSASEPLPVAIGGPGAQLVSNVTLAANSGSTPVTVVGGSYIFDAQFTGTSVKLQALGSDSTTWRDVTTLSASGSTGVVLGAGASVRLYNPNAAGLTGVYASLS